MRTAIVAVDLGGTHVSAGLVQAGGAAATVAGVQRLPLGAEPSAEDILGTLVRAIGPLPAEALVAVAVPGPFDYAAGIALYTGVGKFEPLHGVDLGAELAGRLGISRERIGFCNDADACGLGEALAGAGAGLRRVLCLTLGTGVGSAYLEDGRALDDDPRVPAGGDAHVLLIDGAPLEDSVSRRALRREYERRTGRLLDVREIAEQARRGDEAAALTLARSIDALGRALAPWIASFDPEAIVVGGSIARSWDLLAPLLGAAFPGREVRPALLGDDAPLLGAAAHAVDARRRSSAPLA